MVQSEVEMASTRAIIPQVEQSKLAVENQLSVLDISLNTELTFLLCYDNQLSEINLHNNVKLKHLNCDANYLTNLDISKNTLLDEFIIANMLTLKEVCVWTMPFPPEGVSVNMTGSPNVEFKDCSGTEIEEYSMSGLSIFPNPTNTLLTIEADQPGYHSMEITSLNGQLTYSEEMEGSTHQIDLSSFQKGVYFITIRSEDFVTTRKIIKL